MSKETLKKKAANKPAPAKKRAPAKARAKGKATPAPTPELAPDKPGRGRKTALTPEVQDKILSALRAGNFFKVACQFAGIGEATGYEWIARANGTDDRPFDPIYAEFAESVKKAEADAEVASLARIREAAKGKGLKFEKITTRTIKGKGGKPDQTIQETTREFFGSAWQADAWFLERKFNANWGRKDRHEHASPNSDKVEHAHGVADLVTKIFNPQISDEELFKQFGRHLPPDDGSLDEEDDLKKK